MDRISRPTIAESELFAALADEVGSHEAAYLATAEWFEREFSITAIDARAESRRHDVERAARAELERQGRRLRKRRIWSVPMERILRAADSLIETDQTALRDTDRKDFWRRVIFVAALATDPDFAHHVPTLARTVRMGRAYWPTPGQLDGTDKKRALALDRWWARSLLFVNPDPKYVGFAERVSLALRHLGGLRRRKNRVVNVSGIGAAARAQAVGDPPDLDPTEKKILASLAAATRAGDGRLLRHLVGDAGVSANSTISRAITRLRSLGYPIENRGGGRGYWLNGERRDPGKRARASRATNARKPR